MTHRNVLTKRVFFLVLLVICAFIFSQGVSANPLVAITVDVESVNLKHCNISLIDQYRLYSDGINFGLERILSILEENGIKGVFFFNVYEYIPTRNWWIKSMASDIDNRGHDIQLHTHPQWAYNKDKPFMHQYTLKEQIEIISTGKQLLLEWTRKPIIAHRAGAYGANINTIKALEENKIFLDSSFFFSHGWCKLNGEGKGFKANRVSRYGLVTEIPVNVFYIQDVPSIFAGARPVQNISKYDINQWIDEHILMRAIDNALDAKIDIIVFFLHSFSFIETRSDGKQIPRVDVIRKFQNILRYLKEKNINFVTFRQIEDLRKSGLLRYDKDDVFPNVRREISTTKYVVKRIILLKGGNSEIVLIIVAVLVSVALGIVYALKVSKRT